MPKASGWYRIGSIIGQVVVTMYFSGYGYWDSSAGINAGGSLMGKLDLLNAAGWGSRVENVSHYIMNGTKMFQKLRIVSKGNDWCYLEVYWGGQNKWGTHLFLEVVGMWSRSF